MARYDRIARLDPPSRSAAFPGWLVFRDLEGRERDPELSRRARARFLALRPALRLTHGLDSVDAASLERQVAMARAELERLPDADSERTALTGYLDQVAERAPAGMAAGLRAVAEICAASGHPFAAEELCRSALALADEHGVDTERIAALRALGRLDASRQDWRSVVEHLESATTLCQEAGDVAGLGGALRDLAVATVNADGAEAARSAVTAACTDAGGEEEDPRVAGIAAAARCALELEAGRPAAALEAGWQAVELLASGDPTRARVLLDLAAACRRLRLHEAAEACLHMVDRAGAAAQVDELLGAAARPAHGDPVTDAVEWSDDVRFIAGRIASMGRERVPSS